MVVVAKAKLPQTTEYQDPTFRNPAKMPIKKDGEKGELYICGVKQGAPFESCALLGIGFHKNVYPSEASLTKNADKRYNSQFIAYDFTEEQVKAVKKRGEETIKVISPRPNPNFDPNFDPNEENLEYLPRLEFPIIDFLFIEKASEYNPISVELNIQDNDNLGEGEIFKQNIYKEQAKKRRGDK